MRRSTPSIRVLMSATADPICNAHGVGARLADDADTHDALAVQPYKAGGILWRECDLGYLPNTDFVAVISTQYRPRW